MSWDGYRTAGFAVEVPFVGRWWVVPDADGTVSGPFPCDGPAVFVTAHNPAGEVLPDSENAGRHAELLGVVSDAEWTWWPALGGMGGDHAEDGVLLVDATEADGLLVGRWFGQDAVYVWTEDALELVACDGSVRERMGWRCVSEEEALAERAAEG